MAMGDQGEHLHNKALVAAALFAGTATVFLALIWYWPHFFSTVMRDDGAFIPATEEEKEAIRAQIRTHMESEQERNVGGAAHTRASIQSDETTSQSDAPEDAKSDIRAQLRAQAP